MVLVLAKDQKHVLFSNERRGRKSGARGLHFRSTQAGTSSATNGSPKFIGGDEASNRSPSAASARTGVVKGLIEILRICCFLALAGTKARVYCTDLKTTKGFRV